MAHSDQRQLEGKKQNQSLETGWLHLSQLFFLLSLLRKAPIAVSFFLSSGTPGRAGLRDLRQGGPGVVLRIGTRSIVRFVHIINQVDPKQLNVVGHQLVFGNVPVRSRGCLTSVPTWAPVLACCEGKTWKSHVFFAGGHDAGLVCTKPGWVYAHVCSEEGREAKKKMGRFQWRLPIRRPALNKSGEISLSLVCVCALVMSCNG